MKLLSLAEELRSNSYPGRGIVIGRSKDGAKAVTAYFIMGRSENSRNRVFVEEGEGIRTQAFDPAKLSDPSLIIYAPVRVLGNKTIVTNGSTREWISSSPLSSPYAAGNLSRTAPTTRPVSPGSCTLKMEAIITPCPS